jgi:hypothetical protein
MQGVVGAGGLETSGYPIRLTMTDNIGHLIFLHSLLGSIVRLIS